MARVKLSESPPLMRNNGDEIPFKLPVSGGAFCAPDLGWGPECGLLHATESGKFEKLLRSDPEAL
jgi:hypothetical protein